MKSRKMYRELTVTGRKPELKGVDQKEETLNQNRMKKQEFRKSEDRLRNLPGHL